ncbi:hypothetical protein GOODEAATRI_030822, partial [Goodea atripinnis]
YTCEAHNNPADFFLDVINGDSTAVTLNSLEGEGSRFRTITYNTSFLTQFKWVLKRTFRNLMLNPQTSVAQRGSLLMKASYFSLCSHEYISGYYRLSVYFLSKILSDIITLRTIPAIVFTCVAYYMIGLKPTAGAFFTFMFTVAMVAYTATSMAMAISADQTVVAIANIYMTITCVFMMVTYQNSPMVR